MNFLLFLWLFIPLTLHADVTTLKLIKLKYRDASEIKALIRPILPIGSKISGKNDKILLRSSPQNVIQIRRLIEKLDTRPKMLQVLISNSAQITSDGSTLVNHYETSEIKKSTKQLQMLEGRGAFIHIGQSVPYISVIRGPFWDGLLQSYRRTGSGIWIVPYLRGKEVELTVVYNNKKLRPDSVMELQKLSTSVTVPLGRWVTLGGLDKSGDSKVYGHYTSKNSQTIRIKVTKVNSR